MDGFEPMYTGERRTGNSGPAEVVVVNFNMSFSNMVVVMVKLAIAAIPAGIIILVVYWAFVLFGAAFFTGLLLK